jgi:hypothetical protein
MPGVEHPAVAGTAARLGGELLALGHHHDALGAGTPRDPRAGIRGGDTVAVAVVGHGAGGGDPAGWLAVAVAGPIKGAQVRPLLAAARADRA